MTRWLAGIFDPSARTVAADLDRSLAPFEATVIREPPLQLAFSGPSSIHHGLVCLLDGHVDNLAQLCQDLNVEAQPGSAPQPEELLAAAYRRWGHDLPSRMRGDFAFLVWDPAKREGLIARDQLGTQPFYLHDDGNGCVRFAGEIRHLIATLPSRPQPDMAAVAHWIALSTLPGAGTLYAGIRRLEAGTMLLLDPSGARVARYWEPRFAEPLVEPQEELTAQLTEALRVATRRRLVTQAANGVLMSGGLDSSSVAVLCAEESDRAVFACSAIFPDHPEADESALIAMLRDELDLRGVVAEVRPGGLLASVLESLAAWEMPLLGWGDFWTLPLLREAARQGVSVMLDGDGGDQLFGARAYVLADCIRAGRPMQALRLARVLPGAAEDPPARLVAKVLWQVGMLGALPLALHNAVRTPPFARSLPHWLRRETRRALTESEDPNAWKRLDGPRWWAHEAFAMTQGMDELGIFEHQRRRAALAGLEARHPLMDLDLVVLSLRQPPRATLDPRLSRPLLRSAMHDRLPDAVRLRPEKARFESLISDCLKGSDGATVETMLTAPDMELGAYVDPAAMRDALFGAGRQAGSFRWMWQMWRLVTIECWLRAQRRPAGELGLTGAVSRPRVSVAAIAPSGAPATSSVFPP